jgi:hypothetical protein
MKTTNQVITIEKEITKSLQSASKEGLDRSITILSIRHKLVKDYCDRNNFICDDTIGTRGSDGLGLGETHQITSKSLSYNKNYGEDYLHLRVFISPTKRYKSSKFGDFTQIYIPVTTDAIRKTQVLIRKRKLNKIQSIAHTD